MARKPPHGRKGPRLSERAVSESNLIFSTSHNPKGFSTWIDMTKEQAVESCPLRVQHWSMQIATQSSINLTGVKKLRSGKVREVFDLGETLLFVVTDRISA